MHGVHEVSLSELAVMHGISAPAVHRKLERLEAVGLLRTRRIAGQRLVDPVAFEQALAVPKTGRSASDRVNEARIRKLNLEARKLSIDIERKLGNLLRIADVVNSTARAAGSVVRAIDELPSFASELTEAARQHGKPAVQEILNETAHHLRSVAADALSAIVAEVEAKVGTLTDLALPREWDDEGTDEEETKPIPDA